MNNVIHAERFETPNFNVEMGRLLSFVGRVATEIRLNSPYNGSYNALNRQVGNDVMWLADCLHNFEMLGNALLNPGGERLIRACENILKSYHYYEIDDDSLQSNPTETFKQQRLFTLEEGRTILRDIMNKARNTNVTCR